MTSYHPLLLETRELVTELIVLDEVDSTNDYLAEHAPDLEPFTLVISDNQRAGRGRMNRIWVSRPGESIALSLLVPLDSGSRDSASWLPLIAGASLVGAVRKHGVSSAALKWPNDVRVGELKLAGILCQIVVDNLAIVGVGLNLDFPDHDRPSPRATALAHQGVAVESALDAILRDFIKGLMTWLSTPEAEKLSAAKTSVEECLDTIGRVVEVRETSGWKWRGEALGLDPAGHLLVRPEHESEPVAVASSDIEHLYQ